MPSTLLLEVQTSVENKLTTKTSSVSIRKKHANENNCFAETTAESFLDLVSVLKFVSGNFPKVLDFENVMSLFFCTLHQISSWVFTWTSRILRSHCKFPMHLKFKDRRVSKCRKPFGFVGSLILCRHTSVTFFVGNHNAYFAFAVLHIVVKDVQCQKLQTTCFQSDHLSLEKLLIHTIQVRSTAKLKDLEREFSCHVPGKCEWCFVSLVA